MQILQIKKIMKIKGIKNKFYNTLVYAILNFYFLKENNLIVYIKWKIYIIKGLNVKILLEMNIIKFKN